MEIEDLLNKLVLCKDGNIRRLLKVEPKDLTLDMPFPDSWLGPMKRDRAVFEKKFLEGTIVTEEYLPIYYEHLEFCADDALADLLKSGQLFVHSAESGPFFVDSGEGLLTVSVSCGDTFAYSCADAEPIPFSELEHLHRMWKEDKKYGSIKWVAQRRGLQPIPPVKDTMIKEGSWNNTMESLLPYK